MDFIKKIALNDLKALDRWTLAPVGAIVQTAIGENTILAMRTEYEDPQGGQDALLVLTGDDFGTVIADHHIGKSPALDVSHLVHFVAIEPSLFDPTTMARIDVGSLLYNPEDGGSYFCWIKLAQHSPIGVVGTVSISSQNPKFPAGKCSLQPSRTGLKGICSRFSVEMKVSEVVLSID